MPTFVLCSLFIWVPRFVPSAEALGANVYSEYLRFGCQGLFQVLRCWVPRFVPGTIALGGRFVPGAIDLGA